MRIDAHVHLWERRMIPDEAIRQYLEPLNKLKELGLDDVFDFNLDDEVPFPDYNENIQDYIDIMDYNRLDAMVVLGIDFGLVNEGRMSNNEYMEWLYSRCSCDERFIPFIGLDPNRKDAVEKLKMYYSKYEPRGIKVYPATGFYPDDERYDEYWKTINDMGLVVTVHTGVALAPLDEKYCHPSFMRRIAEKYPDMKIIIAHLGGKFHDELFPLMDACDNVYSDCSALQGWKAIDKMMINTRLRECASRYPKRIVYGSDIPIYEFSIASSQFIGMIEEGDWGTERMKKDVMGDNMARILEL